MGRTRHAPELGLYEEDSQRSPTRRCLIKAGARLMVPGRSVPVGDHIYLTGQLDDTGGSSATTGVFCPAASHHRPWSWTSTYIAISLNPPLSALLRI